MEADYSHLPADVLRLVFRIVFGGDQVLTDAQRVLTPGSIFTLQHVYRQWAAIRLTCRHWDEVLTSAPPPLHVSIPAACPSAMLTWLPSVPLTTLSITDGRLGLQAHGAADEGEGGSVGGRCEEQWGEGEAGGGQERLLGSGQLLLGMEGVGPQPFWSPAALLHLQTLHISHGSVTEGGPAVFDAAPLGALNHLANVALGQFTGYELAGLPGAVRMLELWYDDHLQFAMPRLPQHLSLEKLTLGRGDGVVGLPLCMLWDRCQVIRVVAPQVLVGVPSPGPLVRQFERPYREGIYVPPHILGDMEALEHSQGAAASCAASELWEGLAGCKSLKELRFEGGCVDRIKVVPMLPADPEALPFIFRSQPAGFAMVRDVNYLYSVNRTELGDLASSWVGEQERVYHEGGRPSRPGSGGLGVPSVGDADPGVDMVVVRVEGEGHTGVVRSC